MPGYASWKTLFKDELFQLREEGYPVRDFAAELGPERNEAEWEMAYWRLWAARDRGIRPDFPYSEPDDLETILAEADPAPELAPLTEAEYLNRLRGGWYGRCGAVVLGKPLEMGYDRLMVKKYLESVGAYPLDDWVPARSETLGITLREDCVPSTLGNVHYVQPDDDIHYTVTALLLAEQKGPNFTVTDVGRNLLDNVPYNWLWVADNQAYYHMVNLTADRPVDQQVAEIRMKLNPWRECMDGHLKADLWGYLTPGDPRRGAQWIHRTGSLSLVKNGLYGGMWVAGCISAAMSAHPTVETILRGGLSCIPRRSRLAEAVRNVTTWYRENPDWVAVCDRIYEHYGHWYFAAAINNLAFVALALLEGGLDFTRTITTAVMCGTDTDCNSATAGSIVGAAIGYDALPQRWIAPLNDTVKTAVAWYGEGKISGLVARTLALRPQFA
jgi:hypothetical protein